jgi:pteridine reductase
MVNQSATTPGSSPSADNSQERRDYPPPVALITGATKRVGRAVALYLADAGFDIAFTYNTSAAAAGGLRSDIEAKGHQCLAIAADLLDPPTATDAIASQLAAKFNRLDFVMNNASIYEPDANESESLAQMRRLWAIHVESPAMLMRRLAPLLEKSRGSIVNMVDLLAERPMPGYLNYCASKAGLLNLTLGFARQLAPNVRVNGIAPGVVAWPDDLAQEKREQYLRRVPLTRAGTPEDVAAAVLFLATAATYMTGQILHLDGGRSIT